MQYMCNIYKKTPQYVVLYGTRKGNRTPVLAVRGPCPNL